MLISTLIFIGCKENKNIKLDYVKDYEVVIDDESFIEFIVLEQGGYGVNFVNTNFHKPLMYIQNRDKDGMIRFYSQEGIDCKSAVFDFIEKTDEKINYTVDSNFEISGYYHKSISDDFQIYRLFQDGTPTFNCFINSNEIDTITGYPLYEIDFGRNRKNNRTQWVYLDFIPIKGFDYSVNLELANSFDEIIYNNRYSKVTGKLIESFEVTETGNYQLVIEIEVHYNSRVYSMDPIMALFSME